LVTGDWWIGKLVIGGAVIGKLVIGGLVRVFKNLSQPV